MFELDLEGIVWDSDPLAIWLMKVNTALPIRSFAHFKSFDNKYHNSLEKIQVNYGLYQSLLLERPRQTARWIDAQHLSHESWKETWPCPLSIPRRHSNSKPISDHRLAEHFGIPSGCAQMSVVDQQRIVRCDWPRPYVLVDHQWIAKCDWSRPLCPPPGQIRMSSCHKTYRAVPTFFRTVMEYAESESAKINNSCRQHHASKVHVGYPE